MLWSTELSVCQQQQPRNSLRFYKNPKIWTVHSFGIDLHSKMQAFW